VCEYTLGHLGTPGALPPRSTLGPVPRAQRIQRPRRKGSVLPEGTIYVGRPTIWGNPFQGRGVNHARSVILHKEWLAGRVGDLTLERMGFHPAEIDGLHRLHERVMTRLHQLAGHDLACWCPLTSEWCHADTLLALAPVHAEFDRLAA
jgi:hypothetical protein